MAGHFQKGIVNMIINDAINTIKETCKTYKICVECPMNFNCNEYPAEWKEVNCGADMRGEDNG